MPGIRAPRLLVLLLIAVQACSSPSSPNPGISEGVIYFASSSGIFRIDPTGTNLERVTNDPGDHDPNISTDGNVLTFTRRGQIAIMDIPSGSVRLLSILSAESPALSPDGASLAYAAIDPSSLTQFDVFIFDMSSGQTRRVAATAAHELHPRWSPGSDSLVFASDFAGTLDVYLLDVNGGSWSRVGQGSDPHWSLSGSKIAYKRRLPIDFRSEIPRVRFSDFHRSSTG